ncbi:MAG: hypothetical protein CME32_13540 [Gimesia sp.]|nr:hypothetical protein [Gimesia sp.]
MQYYVIDSTLNISVVDQKSDQGIYVPTQYIKARTGNICIVHGEESEALSRVIADHLGDLESDRIFEESGERVCFSMCPPDAWLMAIGAVMLEGLIQGLSWDVVKLAVQQSLDLLKTRNATPTPVCQKNKTKKSLDFEIYLDLPVLGELYFAIEGNYESYCELEKSMEELHKTKKLAKARKERSDKQTMKKKGKKSKKDSK